MNNIVTSCSMKLRSDKNKNTAVFMPVQIRYQPHIPEIVRMTVWSEHLSGNLPNVTATLLNYIFLALNMIPVPTGFNDGFYEKLVLWEINEPIPSEIDLHQLSNELRDHDITLVFVTDVILDFQTWDLYRETARSTGGELLSFSIDSTALEHAILSVIYGEDTLRQAFVHPRMQQNTTIASHSIDANEQTQSAASDLIFQFDP